MLDVHIGGRLYSRSEYDGFHGRLVAQYTRPDGTRVEVLDFGRPAYIVPPADPDAQLQRERLPMNRPVGNRRLTVDDASSPSSRKRQRLDIQRLDAIVTHLRRHPQGLRVMELMRETGIRMNVIGRLLREHPELFEKEHYARQAKWRLKEQI